MIVVVVIVGEDSHCLKQGGDSWDSCTVDRVHPNDLGFYRMARRIEEEIRKILK